MFDRNRPRLPNSQPTPIAPVAGTCSPIQDQLHPQGRAGDWSPMRRFSLRLPPVFPQVMISQVMLWGTLVGAGTGLGVVAPILAPQAAIAYEARTTVTIDHEPGESYNTLLRRAEAVGRAAAQRYFGDGGADLRQCPEAWPRSAAPGHSGEPLPVE